MTLVTDTLSRRAVTTAALLQPLVERWSPRSYDASAVIGSATIETILEAARWAPSANNSQPWRFVVAHRGTETFRTVHDNLLGFNQAWAEAAAALIVNIAEVRDSEGAELRWAEYDLGQAVAHLTIQAQHEGLHTHQMGGFEGERLHAALGLAESFEIVSITAIGVVGAADALPEGTLRERESAPRTRRALSDLVLEV